MFGITGGGIVGVGVGVGTGVCVICGVCGADGFLTSFAARDARSSPLSCCLFWNRLVLALSKRRLDSFSLAAASFACLSISLISSLNGTAVFRGRLLGPRTGACSDGYSSGSNSVSWSRTRFCCALVFSVVLWLLQNYNRCFATEQPSRWAPKR